MKYKALILAIPFVFILLAPTKTAVGKFGRCSPDEPNYNLVCHTKYEVRPNILSEGFWCCRYTRNDDAVEQSYNKKNGYVFYGLLLSSVLVIFFIKHHRDSSSSRKIK